MGDTGSWLRAVNGEFEVVQMSGGTRGTDYVYVEDAGFFVNVRHLKGSKLVSRERWGRGRRREVFRVPKNVLVDKVLLRISFTNSGYVFLRICRVSPEAVDCYDCFSPSEGLARALVQRFKPVGGESQFIELYLGFVVRMVSDIWRVVRSSGFEDIHFGGHAERLYETLTSPYLSLLTSLAIDTWQGRILSLQEKVSHVAELWVLANIVEALEGEAHPNHRVWWIEFTQNIPLAVMRSNRLGRYFTAFYQPSIYPHIASMFSSGKKRYHLIPDIAILEGIIEERLGWGEFHKLVEKGHRPVLLIEVKTGLETSEWRAPQYLVEQLEAYRKLLDPKHIMLVVLSRLSPYIRTMVRSRGFEIFDELLNPAKLKHFKDHIVKTLL